MIRGQGKYLPGFQLFQILGPLLIIVFAHKAYDIQGSLCNDPLMPSCILDFFLLFLHRVNEGEQVREQFLFLLHVFILRYRPLPLQIIIYYQVSRGDPLRFGQQPRSPFGVFKIDALFDP